jgi:hypothetical protein
MQFMQFERVLFSIKLIPPPLLASLSIKAQFRHIFSTEFLFTEIAPPVPPLLDRPTLFAIKVQFMQFNTDSFIIYIAAPSY